MKKPNGVQSRFQSERPWTASAGRSPLEETNSSSPPLTPSKTSKNIPQVFNASRRQKKAAARHIFEENQRKIDAEKLPSKNVKNLQSNLQREKTIDSVDDSIMDTEDNVSFSF